MHLRLHTRLLALLGALLALALPAGATWSIVAINLRTGEVAVGTATCLSNFNLRNGVPVIVVGKGAAAAQSFLDQGAVNRRVIFNSFRNGVLTPQEILDGLALSDAGHQGRQYGIVAFTGDPVTFTGTGAGNHASGVTGQVGDYVYAIQGNILTGIEVIMAAEDAFRNTNGDMTERLMFAMQAARAFGGDGRCSCPDGSATSCGSPPESFEKSAHVGTMIVARIGDSDGTCGGLRGCARGQYYMLLNVIDGIGGPDPVFQLQDRYDTWRSSRSGRPDGILSRVTAIQSLPADGRTKRSITVQLRDLDDNPLTIGGADVRVETVEGERSFAGVGPVFDHGDGTYSFTITAGTVPGTDRLQITATDDSLTATLFPYLEVETVAPMALHAGYETVSITAGATVPFVIDVPAHSLARYVLLGSLSGTTPGVDLGPSLHIPLNPDWMTLETRRLAGRDHILPDSVGRLDREGRAEAAFIVPPGMLLDLAGLRMDWSAVLLGHGLPGATNAVGFDIVP